MKIAIIGTGTMGAAIARTLLRNDFDVTVWNRSVDRARPLEDDGARVASDSADAVKGADIVLTILFDEKAVLETAGQFLGAMKPGAVWMQSATVGPAGARRIAELAAEHGVDFVDAPAVGTKQPAESGELVMLVSGAASSIEKISPVLDAIGAKTTVVSEIIGDANALKLACNAWVAAITAASAQSLAICTALGVDPTKFLQTIEGTASDTQYLQLKGKLMLRNDFAPSFAVDGLLKDIGLMIDAAGTDVSPLLVPLRNVYAATSAAGRGSDDIAAIYSTFG